MDCKLGKRIKKHKFFEQFVLSPDIFDTEGNIEFGEEGGIIERRGSWPYFQPYACKRYGLKVKSRYGSENWIGMENEKGEWPVAFHGVYSPAS